MTLRQLRVKLGLKDPVVFALEVALGKFQAAQGKGMPTAAELLRGTGRTANMVVEALSIAEQRVVLIMVRQRDVISMQMLLSDLMRGLEINPSMVDVIGWDDTLSGRGSVMLLDHALLEEQPAQEVMDLISRNAKLGRETVPSWEELAPYLQRKLAVEKLRAGV